MAFQHKLKQLRESNNLSMEELVNELHKRYGLSINKSTVSRWENGAEPKGKDLHILAHFFKVSPSELIDLELDSLNKPNLNETLEHYIAIQANRNVKEQTLKNKQSDTESLKLPLYGSVAAGALAEVDGVTTESVEFITLPVQFLGKYSECKDLFAMTVNGDSMNKVVKDGGIVIARPLDLHQYKDGDIVIFSYNNEYSLKRFCPDELEGYVLFKAESTDKSFKDIPIKIDTLNDLKIYGKVIFYGNTI